MTYIELFRILSKTWANVNDIKLIASCGRDKAITIRNDIRTEIQKNGYNLPTAKEILVPMEHVTKYLNLDIDYISLMAEKEKKFKL